MPKNPNNKIFYCRDENLSVWEKILKKSGFVNWCLQNERLVKKFQKYADNKNK